MNVLVGACLWVVAAAAVSLLPMRWQIVPGLALLAAVPLLLWQIGAALGWPAVAIGALVVISVFRRPLSVLWRRGASAVNGGAG